MEGARTRTPDFCLPLDKATDVSRVGGKGANLARVRALGFRVPETIVVTCEALRRVVDASGLEAELDTYLRMFDSDTNEALIRRHGEVGERFRAAGMPDEVRQPIIAAIEQLLVGASAGLAIPSSAEHEDSDRASFAGVLENRIGARDVATAAGAVVDCWVSAWAPRALRYLRRTDLDPAIDAMAVLIQPVIAARSAGVICTANPARDLEDGELLHLDAEAGVVERERRS